MGKHIFLIKYSETYCETLYNVHYFLKLK